MAAHPPVAGARPCRAVPGPGAPSRAGPRAVPGPAAAPGRGGRQGSLCPCGRAGSDGAHAGAEEAPGRGASPAPQPRSRLCPEPWRGAPCCEAGPAPQPRRLLRSRPCCAAAVRSFGAAVGAGRCRSAGTQAQAVPSLRGRRSRRGRARLSLRSFVPLSGRAFFIFCPGASPGPGAPPCRFAK